ncbi:MAG: aldo/keto reductase [Oligoflexus sp.]
MSLYASLANGEKIPKIGLGTWKSAKSDVSNAVKAALDCGYQHIDCAYIYLNEDVIGEVLAQHIAAGLKRENIFVTSKLWNSFHHPDDVAKAIDQSLKDLRLDYLDLYLIHWPIAFKRGKLGPDSMSDLVPLSEIPLSETWQAMENLVTGGKVKSIGVSNFSINRLKELQKAAKIKPVVNQIECHPYLPQKDLTKYCGETGVHITAYSPLGSPDRSAAMRKEKEPSLLNDPLVSRIAKKHNASPGQVLISWQLHRGHSVIPKSVSPDRIKENLKSAELCLDDDDMAKLMSMNQQFRFVQPDSWFAEGSPYQLENFW